MASVSPMLPLVGLPPRFLTGLTLSLAAGFAYLLAAPLVDGAGAVVLKGSGVALLAITALQLAVPGARWLAAIMALGALGDVLLELPGLFIAGAASFAAGHAVAIAFYARHRRNARRSDWPVPLLLVGWGVVMPLALVPPARGLWPALVYALLLTTMAAMLWRSRFPRLAAWGAIAFIASDTLLVLRMGGGELFGPIEDGALVWISYFAGQWLITLGVGRGLLARAAHGS